MGQASVLDSLSGPQVSGKALAAGFSADPEPVALPIVAGAWRSVNAPLPPLPEELR
jgi:hypothetical protein